MNPTEDHGVVDEPQPKLEWAEAGVGYAEAVLEGVPLNEEGVKVEP